MAKEYDVLLEQAETIRTEVEDDANSAERVGGMFKDIIEKSKDESGRKLAIKDLATSVGYSTETSLTQDAATRLVSEYNVSINHPTAGVDETNRYTLSEAIAKVPAELRNAGVKVSFLDESGSMETWEFQGESWAIGSFSQVGAGKLTELDKKTINNKISIESSLPLNSRFIEFEIGDTNGGIAGEDDNDNAPKRFRSKDVISISSQPSASIIRSGFTPSVIFRFHKEDGTYIGTEYTDEAKKMRIILANVNGNNNVDLRNLQECILTYNSLDYKCTKYNLAASVDNLPQTDTANITWAEIGDSFVDPDNNNGNGYGKIIREKLGIPQANHHVAGFSGYSWVTFYLYAILGNAPKLNVITKDEDFISIGLGTNDWGANKLYPIGTKEDYINNTFVYGNNSTYTSYGAARKVIDWLIENRGKNTPNVILLSPMHRGQFSFGTFYRPSDFIIEDGKQKYIENTVWLNKNLSSEGLPTVENGFTLLDVYNMVKWIAEYEGFTFVDFFNKGFVKTRFLNQGYQSEAPSTSPEVYTDQLSDNLHPYTEKGKNSYASMVYQYGFIPLLKLVE